MSAGDLIGAASFALISFAICLGAITIVKRSGVVDAPDGGRKQQRAAVPRLGGVAIAAGALLGGLISCFILFFAWGVDPLDGLAQLGASLADLMRGYESIIVFVTGAFLLGLWDDIWTANTKLKLLGLAALSLGAAAFGLVPAALSSPWGELTLPLILVIGSAAWLLVFTNAVNFIDGADGLAVGSLAIMLIGLAVIGTVVGDWTFSILWFPLFGAIAAFLLHNLRGTLYAGDAGALGLGALFAALSLASGVDIWTIATLALPFLIDVLMTLIWRARHGRNWLEPHLDHAYQRMIASGWSALDVAILYWGLSAVSAAAAYIAAQGGGAAPFAVFWGLCFAGIALWIRHRRSAQ
jgi:UDP-N-acetylmuramyl pentapeptide phosphotransferase/UDP-N-acetylglucosamine-1-phosphate transferase